LVCITFEAHDDRVGGCDTKQFNRASLPTLLHIPMTIEARKDFAIKKDELVRLGGENESRWVEIEVEITCGQS
jgi:hypothetical protein